MICAAEIKANSIQEKMRITQEIAPQNTIEWCETVVDSAFREQCTTSLIFLFGQNGFSAKRDIYCSTYNDCAYVLEADGYHYANKKISYTCNPNVLIHFPTLKNYLAKHCLKVDIRQEKYSTYGSGSFNGYKVRIYVSD